MHKMLILGSLLRVFGFNTFAAEPALEFRFEVTERTAKAVKKTNTNGEPIFLEPEPLDFGSSDVLRAWLDDKSGFNIIWIEFTPAAGKRFGDITEKNEKRRLAILSRGRVLTAPLLFGRIDSPATISGNFDAATAKKIVDDINASRTTRGTTEK